MKTSALLLYSLIGIPQLQASDSEQQINPAREGELPYIPATHTWDLVVAHRATIKERPASPTKAVLGPELTPEDRLRITSWHDI